VPPKKKEIKNQKKRKKKRERSKVKVCALPPNRKEIKKIKNKRERNRGEHPAQAAVKASVCKPPRGKKKKK
jgi:hypothetical protein